MISSGCVDNPKYADICPSLAACGNYCNDNKVWAQKNCPKSCNMCPPGMLIVFTGDFLYRVVFN